MTVRLYTREGCHLCEVVEALLGELAEQLPHRLERVDIDTDADLKQRYGWAVPVVIVDDRWRLVTRIDRRMLVQTLRRTL